MRDRPYAIYHEHPLWFRPLFTELERREISFVAGRPLKARTPPRRPTARLPRAAG